MNIDKIPAHRRQRVCLNILERGRRALVKALSQVTDPNTREQLQQAYEITRDTLGAAFRANGTNDGTLRNLLKQRPTFIAELNCTVNEMRRASAAVTNHKRYVHVWPEPVEVSASSAGVEDTGHS